MRGIGTFLLYQLTVSSSHISGRFQLLDGAEAVESIFETSILVYCQCLVKSLGHVFQAVLTADIFEGFSFP